MILRAEMAIPNESLSGFTATTTSYSEATRDKYLACSERDEIPIFEHAAANSESSSGVQTDSPLKEMTFDDHPSAFANSHREYVLPVELSSRFGVTNRTDRFGVAGMCESVADIDIRDSPTPLEKRNTKEFCIAEQVALPQPTGLCNETIEPFETALLHPHGSLADRASNKIKCCAHPSCRDT
ncbi:hypothetical protein ASF51_01715 [Agreia sp. Leaf283]|nr:hypothetical protein ASF51_01715 [Agreia sp. Leaf283]